MTTEGTAPPPPQSPRPRRPPEPSAPLGHLDELAPLITPPIEPSPAPGPSGVLGTGATTGAAGRARALTVISPLPRIWSPLLKLALFLKRRRGPDPTLQRLSLIHAAHWVVIDRFPGEPRRRRYAYLLFLSNFNGSWREYIDAFATAIPRRMAILWGTSYGFPGAQPPTPFVNYIERGQLAPNHFYAAYPQASATEIASALRVRERLRDDVLPAAREDDADGFARAWERFLTDVQRDL
jgi:hypothetical protein